MVIRCSVNNASTFFFFYYIKMCARAHYGAMQFTGEYYFIFSCARVWRVRALWRVKNPRGKTRDKIAGEVLFFLPIEKMKGWLKCVK